MAKTEIVDARGENDGITGEVQSKGSRIKIVSRSVTDAVLGKTSRVSGSSNSGEARGNREPKRGTFTVEDSGNNDSQPFKVEGKKEPAPRTYPKGKVVYPTLETSKSTAGFIISAIEVIGVTTAGPIGEMTEFERGMISPPLARIISRTPVSFVDKASPIIDGAVLIIGLGIYANRAFGGLIPKAKPKFAGTQEDLQAPQAAPVTQTVSTIKAGDIDGTAVPVPSVISQHMNGNI